MISIVEKLITEFSPKKVFIDLNRFPYLKHYATNPIGNKGRSKVAHAKSRSYAMFRAIMYKHKVMEDDLLKNENYVLQTFIKSLERSNYQIRSIPQVEDSQTIKFDVEYWTTIEAESPEVENKTRCQIELLESQTLDTLCNAIIYKWFGWDDPHFYAFFLDNQIYSQNRESTFLYQGPGNPAEWCIGEIKCKVYQALRAGVFKEDQVEEAYMQIMSDPSLFDAELSGRGTNITLKELNLKQGHEFIFLFDFGDEHIFSLTMSGHGTVKPLIYDPNKPFWINEPYPKVYNTMGVIPEQYPQRE
ncbi:MAG: hypothetical protein QXP38_13245 [Nitrososphaerota archaeon]